jgi:hypothetical protein
MKEMRFRFVELGDKEKYKDAVTAHGIFISAQCIKPEAVAARGIL